MWLLSIVKRNVICDLSFSVLRFPLAAFSVVRCGFSVVPSRGSKTALYEARLRGRAFSCRTSFAVHDPSGSISPG
jgi:hypothetical protein